MRSAVFSITQNTVRRFTLGQILVMAAINRTEAVRKAGRGESGLIKEGPARAA